MFVDARSSQLATGRDIDSATKTDINSLRYSQSGFPAGRCALCIQFIYRPQMGASLLQEASLQLRHTRQSPLTRIASLSFRPPLPRRPRNNDTSFIAAETTEPLSETVASLRYSRRLRRLQSCTPASPPCAPFPEGEAFRASLPVTVTLTIDGRYPAVNTDAGSEGFLYPLSPYTNSINRKITFDQR